MEKEVRELYRFMRRYASFKGVGWWVIDAVNDPDHFYCNDEIKKMFGLNLHSRCFSIRDYSPIAGSYNPRIHKADARAAVRVVEGYRDLLENRRDTFENSFPYIDQNGKTRYFKSQARVLRRDPEGHAQILYGILQEITHEKELEKLLEIEKDRYRELSETDPLTDLLNRRKFDELFAYLFEGAQRNGIALGVVMMDLDHFKTLNDRLGHFAGDDALVSVARILRRFFSRQNDLVSRYGGDEFLLAFYCTDRENLHRRLELLRHTIRRRFRSALPPQIPRVSLSVGACFYLPSTRISPNRQALVRQADANLYLAKSRGRNRVVTTVCTIDP